MTDALDYNHLFEKLASLTNGSLVGAADKVAAIMAETAAELQNSDEQTDESYIAYLLDL